MKNYLFQNDTLTVFEGFYESNLFSSVTEYYLNELMQDEEHFEIYEITGDNYENYKEEVCELHADSLQECIADDNLYNGTNIVKSIKFHNMTSPRFYNFTTDKLQLIVDFNLTKLKKYCFNTNNIDFNFYLNKKYSSYSGYISFVDNNIKDFINTYNTDDTKRDMYIGVMLEYYFIRCIFDNAMCIEIYNDNMYDVDTSYKQRIYEQLTELQINNSTIVHAVEA